jgi:hypothetical protein
VPEGPQGLVLMLMIGFPLEVVVRWGIASFHFLSPIIRDTGAFFFAFVAAGMAVSIVNRRRNAQRS